MACYVLQYVSHLIAVYASVLNPLLDPNQLILGFGWHQRLRTLLEHAKHASPDYQNIVHPLHRLGALFCSEGSLVIVLGA